VTKEEANRICAEFMGWELSPGFTESKTKRGYCIEGYHPSDDLNVLVPAWEKLELIVHFDICRPLEDKNRWQFYLCSYTGTVKYQANGETIQEAAAIATAKAIQELNNSNKTE